ncbi:MAG: cytochrome c oxidase assembly factor 1 family protein [Phycisphaeraceae bacterium]|nr:cytochrome c oxidase assembly factor 1 family protein [Phycisphaeraceae bacterium]
MDDYQNDFANDLTTPAFGQEPRRSWFGRNWFWLVPVLILVPLCCCCGGPLGLFWWGASQLKSMPPYVDSVTAAEQDPAVQQALGTPIEVPTVLGFPNGGDFDFSFDATGQTFEATIVLNGSAASGTLRIEAQSPNGVTWTYTVRQVELADGTVIDLIPAGQGGTPPTDDAPVDDSADPESPEAPETKTPDE